jgi:hypothetical protein
MSTFVDPPPLYDEWGQLTLHSRRVVALHDLTSYCILFKSLRIEMMIASNDFTTICHVHLQCLGVLMTIVRVQVFLPVWEPLAPLDHMALMWADETLSYPFSNYFYQHILRIIAPHLLPFYLSGKGLA